MEIELTSISSSSDAENTSACNFNTPFNFIVEFAPVDAKNDGLLTINLPPAPENSITYVFDLSPKSERPRFNASVSTAPPAVSPNLCNTGRPLS